MFHLLLTVIYISFISLGLPDGLLGAAWPIAYAELGVPVSWAGVVSVIISLGTILSSLLSDRLTHKLGTGAVTAISVTMTAAALFGFSASSSFWMLCLWAVPYGLGAGGVDASLNNYVALHYTSRHMSWLHCMWGLGAAIGPHIMGSILTAGGRWPMGYRTVAVLQTALAAALFLTLKLWRGTPSREAGRVTQPLDLRQVLAIPGAVEILVTFFCYCALEQTAALWASSWLALHRGVQPETAARFAGMFYIGITLGRGLNGFLTIRFSDDQLIRGGFAIIGLGAAAMALPLGQTLALAGLILVGLGCAPVYPCIIHSTPEKFGAERSQALIGVQMASAYVGSCLTPPIYGWLAQTLTPGLLPYCLLAILLLMWRMHRRMLRKV